MNKGYSATLMKVLIGCMLIFIGSARTYAQQDITVGTGTTAGTGTGYPAPIQDYYEGARQQFLFLASELQAAGMGPGNINSVKFNVTSLGTFTGEIRQMQVKVGTTSVGSLGQTATDWLPTTAVYGPVDFTPTAGVNTLAFSTPFFWNGTSNLIIEICNGFDTNTGNTDWTSNPLVLLTTGLAFNGSHAIVQDNAGSLCALTTGLTPATNAPTSRPNIIFNWAAAAPCAGTPNAGTATASVATVCVNQSFTVSVSGSTVASGLTYQWQRSTDNGVTWTNIAGATNLSYTGTQIQTSQYRLVVTCTNGNASANSNAVTVSSPAIAAGTYTINSASPTNFPTGTNFATFNDAYNAIKCGISAPVIFNVLPGANAGVYTEQLLITGQIPGASATNTVTFQGNGNTLQFTPTTNERAVVKLNGTNWFRFDSLVVTNLGGTYGYGFQLTNDADSNTIRRCRINVNATSNANTFAGIVASASATDPIATGVSACSDNLIELNTINGGFYGISMAATVSAAAANRANIIRNNQILNFYSYGIYMGSSDLMVISGNTISRPTRATVGAFNGIYFTTNSTSALVSQNRIQNPFGGNLTSTADFYGIAFVNTTTAAGVENNLINNLIAADNGNGLAYGIHSTGSGFLVALHNTIAMDSAASTPTAQTRGINQASSDAFLAYDNIVSIKRGGTGIKYGIYFQPLGTAGSDYNDVYMGSTSGASYFGFSGANRLTIADWRAATQQDLNSYTADPLFVNPAAYNYEPDNAAFDNRGLYAGIDVDINNTPRNPGSVDIGAYEFVPPGCIAPPTPGKIVFNRNDVCVNTTVFMQIQGSSFGLNQEFQWQSAPSQNGPFTNFGPVLAFPDTTIVTTQSYWFRMAVTCSGQTRYSDTQFLKVNPYLPAGTYTIDSNQVTTYVPGVAGGNFRNFTEAAGSMGCGIGGPVVFNVTSTNKVYNEQLLLKAIPNLSTTNTITFNGNGQRIQFNNTVNNSRAVIRLDSMRYVTIDSMVIEALNPDGTTNQGVGVQLLNNSDTNTIRRSTIIIPENNTSQNYVGILINSSLTSATATGSSNSDNNLIENNRISGGYIGISILSSATVRVSNNRIVNNTIRDFYSSGIQLGVGSDLTLVEGNRISRPTRAIVGAGTGIFASGAANGSIITRNRIFNLLGGNTQSTLSSIGINHNEADATATAPHSVTNNFIYGFTGNGQAIGIQNTGTDFIRYYHNSIAIDNDTVTGGSFARGFFQQTQATGIEFQNNIVSISRKGTGQKHVLYLATTGTTGGTAITSDYNDLFVDPNSTNGFIGFFGANRTTFADWKLASKLDSFSLNFDPLWRNLAAGDLTFLAAPIDNKGRPLGIPVDINLSTRSATTPDMGAVEFTVPPCTGTPLTNATVNPTGGICVDVPITLDIPGTQSASGQIFFWENAPTANGPWTRISDTLYLPRFTTGARAQQFYRAEIRCGNSSTYSTVVQVNMNFLLPAGTYTINNTLPTTPLPIAPGGNFNTYNEAVNALYCGITGPVFFNVVTTANNYNEQVRIGRIPGMSAANRVTFQGAPGNTVQPVLEYDATSNLANYTVRLDTASFITFRNVAIRSLNAGNGRAIEFAGLSNNDSLVNCTLTAPATNLAANSMAVVFANQFRGNSLVIRGNSVNGGSTGIWLTGTAALPVTGQVIDSNQITGAYQYGIYNANSSRQSIRKNTVTIDGTNLSGQSYGIYTTQADTSARVNNNTVRINNTTTNVYGIYLNASRADLGQDIELMGNTIIADANNTGNIYGVVNFNSDRVRVINNVAAINSAGTIAYGIFSSNASNSVYYNNTSRIGSASVNGYAMYLAHTSTASSGTPVRNNILSNTGGGRALYIANSSFIISDYNFLHATGTNLVQSQTPNQNYTSLASWQNVSFQDKRSISYTPAFVSTTDLRPNLGNPDVWAMHGRGVQVVDNNRDINDNPRPTLRANGVPDMGAYEFYPSVNPPALQSIPAGAPAANSTQYWMFGTDTVAKVNWKTAVPANPVTFRRFSGVVPRGLPASADSMYFYTEVNDGVQLPGIEARLQQYYVESWLGTIPNELTLGLGRTTASNAWVVGAFSRANVVQKYIWEDNLTLLGKFTGLVNPYAPPVLPDKDSSNKGKRFWLAYGTSQAFLNTTGNAQDQVIYMSTDAEAATVQVRINGTNYFRNYYIPPYTTRSTSEPSNPDPLPKAGADDARLIAEGISNKGISITSDVNITAYTHQYESTNSGATLLLPVGVWGYEYYTMNNRQYWGANSYTAFHIIADNDSTLIEITPAAATLGGRPANTPFQVYLNKGQVFNVLGAGTGASTGVDLTGSRVKSIPNLSGKCFPIALFSGSTRTGIGCNGGQGSSGDYASQQIFPFQAWGKHYLTAPASNSSGPNAGSQMTHVYRVMVRDANTIVYRNGTRLTGLVNQRYYEFDSGTPDSITASKPVMVAQYFASSGSCANTSGDGDPEMLIISPIEQGVKETSIYRQTLSSIASNWITIIVPNGGTGLTSLRIEGLSITAQPAGTIYTFPHSVPGYTVVTRRWPQGIGTSRITSDSAFTGIAYGLGNVESYGVNVGTLVLNLNSISEIRNDSATGTGPNTFTCQNATFRVTAFLPVRANTLRWQFNRVPGLQPNLDTTIVNPVPNDSVSRNSQFYYAYTFGISLKAGAPGVLSIPITYTSPDIESCDNSRQDVILVQVLPAPPIEYSLNFSGCEGNTAQFFGEDTTSNGIILNNWRWTLPNNTIVNTQNTSYQFNTAGQYVVKLSSTTADGCIGDTNIRITVNPLPTVQFQRDTFSVCNGTRAIVKVSNLVAGTTYNWYATQTGGSIVATGDSILTTPVTAPLTYWVEGIRNGCSSTGRTRVTLDTLIRLLKVNATATIIDTNRIQFSWNAVPGATAYQVSVNGGAFVTPSSGPQGTTHLITGLTAFSNVKFNVRAIADSACQSSVSDTVSSCVLTNIAVLTDNVRVCSGTNVVLTVRNPVAGVAYTWYDAATGGNQIGTGTSIVLPNTTTGRDVYVQGLSVAGCITSARAKATISILQPLAQPAPVVSGTTANSITFTWPAVPNASSYQVSVNGGAYATPSSGATGLTHTVNNVNPLQNTTLQVRALADSACQTSTSAVVSGCIGTTVTVDNAAPQACVNSTVTITVTNPGTGVTYNWYTAATGGSPVFTGATFTTPTITAATTYYVEGTGSAGCVSGRTPVNISILQVLATPVASVDSIGANALKFRWNAVAGATGYQVSINGGAFVPANGNLVHTVTGLQPLTTVTFVVRAIAANACQNSTSLPVQATTRPDGLYIPNAFSPNGDGRNDRFTFYSYAVKEARVMIYNQYGEKVWETMNPNDPGWDGTYKGKQQPVGVYIYVGRFVMSDGTVQEKKGSINLVR